jgi:hypothetical protein
MQHTHIGNRSEILPDAAVHSEHGELIRCDIRAKLVERYELECQIW